MAAQKIITTGGPQSQQNKKTSIEAKIESVFNPNFDFGEQKAKQRRR